jgi:adenosylcobinamide kinase/adenosylcobinamide-phosphate guanylyltransferase
MTILDHHGSEFSQACDNGFIDTGEHPLEHSLILGGARSGKSQFAEQVALKSGLSLVYVATAEALDDEMAHRISEHRRRRDENWHLIEEPQDIAAVIKHESAAQKLLLIDCLTLWLSNLLLRHGHGHGHEKEKIILQINQLCRTICDANGPVLFVSNEVGFCLTPENALGRQFRDLQGGLNQQIGAVCDNVVLVVAGMPLTLKGRNVSA